MKHKDDAKFHRDRHFKSQNVLDAVQRDIDIKDGIVHRLKSQIGSLTDELQKWREHRCSKHPEIQRLLDGLRRELKQDEVQRKELILKLRDREKEWNEREQRFKAQIEGLKQSLNGRTGYSPQPPISEMDRIKTENAQILNRLETENERMQSELIHIQRDSSCKINKLCDALRVLECNCRRPHCHLRA